MRPIFPAPKSPPTDAKGDVIRRIKQLGGPVYEFIEFCLDGRIDLSISELRELILQAFERIPEIHVVILADPSRLGSLGERMLAALGHARAQETLGDRLNKVWVGEAIGGGGIGDIRRVWRIDWKENGGKQGLRPSDDVLKIVERPHRNLVNTDLEILESRLPELTTQNADYLTPFLGVGRGLRRGEWTLVQRLTYQPIFHSFQDLLSNIADPLCNPVIIVELLKQSAKALRVLHQEGIAHRDFKADAILVSFKPGLAKSMAERLIVSLPRASMNLYRRCIQARIFDFDTVGVTGRQKDPKSTTSSSENARIENPRELSQVFVESDQYPLGIAAMRLFPDLWGDIRGVMRHGMAVAVPMKIMFVRQTLEDRRRHFVSTYAALFSCSEKVSAELVDIVLQLIAFEPEDRFRDLDEMIRRLDAIQGELPTDSMLSLIQDNAVLFEDVEELIAGLLSDHPKAPLFEPKPKNKVSPQLSWKLAMALGLAVGGGGLYLLQDKGQSPTPAATPTVQRALAVENTPTPTLKTAVTDGTLPTLDLNQFDETAIYQTKSLPIGQSLNIPLTTTDGLSGSIYVERRGGDDRWNYDYVLTLGQVEKRFSASTHPVVSIQEEILSTSFGNYCSPSDPARARRFIQKMPESPLKNDAPLSARFVQCDGGNAALVPVSISRLSATRFRLTVDGQAETSAAPRVDLCNRIENAMASSLDFVKGLDCDSIALKLRPPVPGADDLGSDPGNGVDESGVLRRVSDINIDDDAHEISYAAETIANLPDNIRVRLKISGGRSFEIVKRAGSITYAGRSLPKGVTTKSALIKAIFESVESEP